MKWKAPKIGSVKKRRIFFWLPELCIDGYYHWLCFGYICEHYHHQNVGQHSTPWTLAYYSLTKD
jgi:hypothetical protein